MPTLHKICRLTVWLMVFHFTNLPIPVAHSHDSVAPASMPAHIAARHAGEADCETFVFHIHCIFLDPVVLTAASDSGVPVDPVVPICPNGPLLIPEFDLDSESKLRVSHIIDALAAPLVLAGFCDPSDIKPRGTECLHQAPALSASWQATFSVMLI